MVCGANFAPILEGGPINKLGGPIYKGNYSTTTNGSNNWVYWVLGIGRGRKTQCIRIGWGIPNALGGPQKSNTQTPLCF